MDCQAVELASQISQEQALLPLREWKNQLNSRTDRLGKPEIVNCFTG
jgi:hypothetical protein